MSYRFIDLIIVPLLLCLLLPNLPSAASESGSIVEGASAIGQQSEVIAGTEKPIELAQAKQAVYFFDDFDGNALKKDWEVLSEDKDSYVVENGNLLIVSGKLGKLSDKTLVNLFKLKESMPKGDWTMTVKFNLDYQTFTEKVYLGLYDNNENYIVATSFFEIDCCNYGYVPVQAVKMAKGSANLFKRNLASSGDLDDWNKVYEWGRNLEEAQYLRLEKRGKSYTVSGKLESGQWIELDKLTAIKARGNLILGFSQYENVSGESTVRIDWVKIETPELPT